MHFYTAALLAATLVTASSQPYKLATGPLLSLARRDTYGYQPEQSVCGAGSTCAEACGSGYEACASDDGNTHCYNPGDNQSCCRDGSGSEFVVVVSCCCFVAVGLLRRGWLSWNANGVIDSCDEGYYCTHDTKMNTWCCPDDLNLVQCAAKFSVDGALETDAASTSSVSSSTSSSSTSAYPTSSSTITKIQPTTSTTKTSSSSTPCTSSHSTSTTKKVTHAAVTTAYTTAVETATTICSTPLSAGHTTVWTSGVNGTVTAAAPTQPEETVSTVVTATTTAATGAGAVSGASFVLLAAAGLVALF